MRQVEWKGAQPLATPVSDRLREAMNGHEIDAFVGCFNPTIAVNSQLTRIAPSVTGTR